LHAGGFFTGSHNPYGKKYIITVFKDAVFYALHSNPIAVSGLVAYISLQQAEDHQV
jgi:hypothetical protein